MKFFSGLIVGLCITLILAYVGLFLLDWHIHQVVVATLQEITNPPR